MWILRVHKTLQGNAATATQWATGRTITVTGGVTGTTSTLDGSGDATLVTTLADLDAAKITSGTLDGDSWWNGNDDEYWIGECRSFSRTLFHWRRHFRYEYTLREFSD